MSCKKKWFYKKYPTQKEKFYKIFELFYNTAKISFPEVKLCSIGYIQ